MSAWKEASGVGALIFSVSSLLSGLCGDCVMRLRWLRQLSDFLTHSLLVVERGREGEEREREREKDLSVILAVVLP